MDAELQTPLLWLHGIVNVPSDDHFRILEEVVKLFLPILFKYFIFRHSPPLVYCFCICSWVNSSCSHLISNSTSTWCEAQPLQIKFQLKKSKWAIFSVLNLAIPCVLSTITPYALLVLVHIVIIEWTFWLLHELMGKIGVSPGNGGSFVC